jgi:hypothetical protein
MYKKVALFGPGMSEGFLVIRQRYTWIQGFPPKNLKSHTHPASLVIILAFGYFKITIVFFFIMIWQKLIFFSKND